MRSMQPILPLRTVQKMRISHTVGDAQARFIRMKSTSKKTTPSIVNLTVKRRYLTEREVERLIDCARKYGRYGRRDATMILVASHASPRLRLQARQRWPRHAGAAALPRAQEYPAHGPLH